METSAETIRAADVSEDESTGDVIPFKNSEVKNGDGGVQKRVIPSDEETEEEGSDDVYVVEKIVGHEFKKNGSLFLQVKWKGYDQPEDQTLEPEDNLLEGAKEVLDEYFQRLGGRPQRPEKSVRKRKSMSETRATSEKTVVKKPRKSVGTDGTEAEDRSTPVNWIPKGKNWEKEVAEVETIIRDPETGGLMAYLEWADGKKSRVLIEQCYEKCPMKMLRFYERHLVFKEG